MSSHAAPPGFDSAPSEGWGSMTVRSGQQGSLPRVAIINGSSRFSGLTLSAVPYVGALSGAGFAVRWYQCLDRGAGPVDPEFGEPIVGAGFRSQSLEMGLNRLWIFPRRVGCPRSEIVLLTDPTLTYIAREHPCRVVLVHDILPLTELADRWDSRLMFHSVLPALRRVARVIVPTEEMAEELARRGIEPDRIRVVRDTHLLGIHPDHIERSVRRVTEERELRILYVATDRSFKNIGFFLRLARAMSSTLPVRFSFTVLSRLRESTFAEVGRLGVDNLRVVERVPSMASLYEDTDVLVYPSLHEGFGRPLIEAAAFGIPIVANRIQPFIELMGNTGRLLPVDAVEPWRAALESLADPKVLRTEAERALTWSRGYRPEAFGARVAEVFGELVGERGRVSAPPASGARGAGQGM